MTWNGSCQFALSLLILSTAQSFLSAQRSIPDDNLAYPVRIDLSNCGNSNATVQGSGFFLNTGTEEYLVTARHVLFNVAELTQPGHALPLLCKKAKLLASSKNPKEEQQNKFELDLEKLNIDGKVKAHSTRDVAVVQIGVNSTQPQADTSKPPTYTVAVIPGVVQIAGAPSGVLNVGIDAVKKFDDVLAANDVYILGYPSSIGIQQAPQIDYNTPLVRKGIVAGLNRSNRMIVLDCLTFFGNSGGPVLQTSHTGLGVRINVIGVVSQYVPFAETWLNTTMSYANVQVHNSGYSMAEPMDAVLELIGK
jgi:hypothetical protein